MRSSPLSSCAAQRTVTALLSRMPGERRVGAAFREVDHVALGRREVDVDGLRLLLRLDCGVDPRAGLDDELID